MSDKTTSCDFCPEPIPYGIVLWMIKTGRTDGDTPIVRIACMDCYESGKTK